jgi:putative FmdB family regulatory protein
MAQYDFVCNECGEAFDVFCTGFIKDEQKKCPKCGSHAVRQKFSSFLRNGSASSSSESSGCGAPRSSGFG